MTPEGKVKKAIKEYLDSLAQCRYFMPQNMGMGESGVSDFIGVYRGKAFAIEAKAPGGKATPWQLRFLNEWQAAGGFACIAECLEHVKIMILNIYRAE